jgi:hypothetical protein
VQSARIAGFWEVSEISFPPEVLAKNFRLLPESVAKLPTDSLWLLLPGTLVYFFKALAMCEGVVQSIDPDSSFADYLQPMVRKLIYQAFAGPDLLGRLRDSATDAAELSIALPRRIDRVLGEIEQGNLRVWTRVEDIEPLMKRLEHLVARSNATLLAAACIVGLAVVMQFYHPRGWQAWIGAVFWIAVAFAIIDYVRTLLTLRRRK